MPAVRKNPADLGSRVLLAELLVFSGNFERADTILDAAARIDPTVTVGIAEFRQLIRAALARRQSSREGRLPEFLGEPTPALRSALRRWRHGARVTTEGSSPVCRGGRGAAPARRGTRRRHALRRFPRRRRSARRFLRGVHHHGQILLDPDRAGGQHRVPPPASPARSRLASR